MEDNAMEVDSPVTGPTRPAPTVILGTRLLAELDKQMCAEGADAIIHLYNWHCCGRCILRLLSIRVIELFKQTELYIQYFLRDYVAKFGKSLPPVPGPPASDASEFCPLCFGLLPHLERPETSDAIIAKISQSGYQLEDYALRLQLPSSLMLRHHRAWSKLQAALPDAKQFAKAPTHDSIVELKEALRWVFSQATFRKLRVEHKHKARLEILVEVSHDESKEEFKAFWPDMIDAGDKGDVSDDEEKKVQQQQAKKKRKRNKDADAAPNPGSLSTVKAKLKDLKRDQLLQIAPEFPQTVKSLPIYELTFFHLPVHIAGRYIKLSRNYSQTPWVLMGTDQRIGSGSVQEVITAVLEPAFKADEVKFSSAGREDRDVRMLGRGRPFLLEFINPRRSRFGRPQYSEFQKAINSSQPDAVQVRDLQFVPPHASTVIKTSQDTKLKDYQCVIWSQDALTPERVEAALGKVGSVTLQQYTPVRVLHRRALAMRERKIHKLTYKFIDEHHLVLDMVTQAGTYVKEFVHGDLGRTRPSIREMLNVSAADLLALDVTDVQVDFPNVLDASFDPAASASSILVDLPKPGERTVIIVDEDAE